MKVYLVEDDAALANSIKLALGLEDIEVDLFLSAEQFLENYTSEAIGCILLDLKLPGMNGIELQTQLSKLGCWLPVIFITGYGEIPDAVAAVRMGAIDFIEKPFSMAALVEIIRMSLEQVTACQENLSRVSMLTVREREIFDLLVAGNANKRIARELDIGLRTVEFHRKNILEKLGTNSLSELVEIFRSLPAK